MHARFFASSTLVMALTCASVAFGQADQARRFEWQLATPESQGISQAKLEAIKNRLTKNKTDCFLVARNDKIVYEWYADDWNRTRPHGTASLAKAIVGGLSLAVAMTDGKISLDHPAAKLIREWRDDPQKSKIKIRHLGS